MFGGACTTDICSPAQCPDLFGAQRWCERCRWVTPTLPPVRPHWCGTGHPLLTGEMIWIRVGQDARPVRTVVLVLQHSSVQLQTSSQHPPSPPCPHREIKGEITAKRRLWIFQIASNTISFISSYNFAL